jgi:hypothetical protein
MAEEKPDSENPGDSVRKYPPFSTTAEGEVTTYTVKDQPPGHRAPNTALLVLSWGVFTIGLYFLYAPGMGYYKDNVTEAKLAITVLLGILTIPVGIFLYRAAHHGFRGAFANMMESGWGQG